MIPKKIHYCWVGGNPLPASVKKCIASWKKYCPDYEIIEWNESNYDFTKNQYMKDAYEAKKWGFVPDYARVDIIYHHGGIYLDTDVQVIKSFNSLLNCKSFFGFEDDENGKFYVALGLGFAGEKGNPLLKEITDSYETISFYNKDGSLNLTPSPILNSTVLEKYGFVMDNHYQSINDNVIYPGDYFDPKSFTTGLLHKTKNTYSIHHYDASWVDEEIKARIKNVWKLNKRNNRIDSIIHFPNRFLINVLGEEKYKRLKQKIKK